MLDCSYDGAIVPLFSVICTEANLVLILVNLFKFDTPVRGQSLESLQDDDQAGYKRYVAA